MSGHLHLLPEIPLGERKMLPAFPKWQKNSSRSHPAASWCNPLSFSWCLRAEDLTSADPAMTNVCWLSPVLADYSLLGVHVSQNRATIHPKSLCWRALDQAPCTPLTLAETRLPPCTKTGLA